MNMDFKSYGKIIRSSSGITVYQYNSRFYTVYDLEISTESTLSVLKLHHALMKDWFTIFNKPLDLEYYSDNNEVIVSIGSESMSDPILLMFMMESQSAINDIMPLKCMSIRDASNKIYSRIIEKACLLSLEYENK